MRRVYEGETLSQALLKMQIDLGKDAIIVGHKKIKKGGILGFLGTTVYQVIAIKPKTSSDQKQEKNINQFPQQRKTQLSASADKKSMNQHQKDATNKNQLLEMLSNRKNSQELNKSNKTLQSNNQSSKLNMVVDDEAMPEFGNIEDITAASVMPTSAKNKNLSHSVKNPYTANKTHFGLNQYKIQQQQPQQVKSININTAAPALAPSAGSSNNQKTVENNSAIIQNNESDYTSKLNEEIQLLKKEIRLLSSNMEKILENSDGISADKIKYPGKLSEVYIRLIENEVDEILADRLINNIKKELNENEYYNLSLVQKLLEKQIIELFPKTEDINLEISNNTPYLMTLVGPTGVGKTTTIAKLGANFSLVYGKKVGFITIDTYRLAAVEQLQKYAEILEVPLKVIFKAEDFKLVLNELKDKDIIFVDTAGRSPKDEEQMYELKEFVRNADAIMDICLVIQATTKYSDIEDIISKFTDIGFLKVIITKIDETLTFGPIVNIVDKYKIPIIYVTTGQDVPDDIEIFEPAKLAKAIIYPSERNE
ncbi:MAG TPA: 50S ribosome-binding GTPase [bacterium]|nr:50S ribosome-binding GTPase [bacterium]